jgi:hypothetical protein
MNLTDPGVLNAGGSNHDISVVDSLGSAEGILKSSSSHRPRSDIRNIRIPVDMVKNDKKLDIYQKD